MDAKQTCPYCKTLHKVFGLFDEGPLFKDKPQTVRCVKCGKVFEAKREGAK